MQQDVSPVLGFLIATVSLLSFILLFPCHLVNVSLSWHYTRCNKLATKSGLDKLFCGIYSIAAVKCYGVQKNVEKSIIGKHGGI